MGFLIHVLKPLVNSTLVPAAAGALVVMALPALQFSRASAQTLPPPLIQADPTPSPSGYPACQSPGRNEYLLLIVTPTPDAQDQLRRSLPATATATVCSYQGSVVTRVSGFTSMDSADAWARYLKEMTGLSVVVARSSETAAPASPPQAAPAPVVAPTTSQQPATNPDGFVFNPKPLGAGYAVLVDFFSRPELAAQVQQALGKEIGLVSYQQRPYLLAVYTPNQQAASAILQTLSDRGFWVMMVDSRRVTLLRQEINLSRSAVHP